MTGTFEFNERHFDKSFRGIIDYEHPPRLILTKKMLIEAEPNSVIYRGIVLDSENGFFMTGNNKKLAFVVFRGEIPDWCIYFGKIDKNWDYIMKFGDKPHIRQFIETIVKFDDDLWEMYRH